MFGRTVAKVVDAELFLKASCSDKRSAGPRSKRNSSNNMIMLKCMKTLAGLWIPDLSAQRPLAIRRPSTGNDRTL